MQLYYKSGFIFTITLIREYITQHQDMKDSLQHTCPISLLVVGHLSNQAFYFIYFKKTRGRFVCHICIYIYLIESPPTVKRISPFRFFYTLILIRQKVCKILLFFGNNRDSYLSTFFLGLPFGFNLKSLLICPVNIFGIRSQHLTY